jgi:hypothetical protein
MAQGTPQRRLPQDDALYGAPAKKAIDAFADDIGEMLDLDRRRGPSTRRTSVPAGRPNANPSVPVGEVAEGDAGRGHCIFIG